MNVGVGVELEVGGFMTVSGMLMVDVNVVDVMEDVVFDVVGLDEVVDSDAIEDAGYQCQHITLSSDNRLVCRSLTSGECS